MCDNLSTKGNVVSGLTKAAAAISQLFDEEINDFAVEFAHWCNTYDRKYPRHKYSYPELLQIFKNR